MNPWIPFKETTSWMVLLRVMPFLIPCLSHQQVFGDTNLVQPLPLSLRTSALDLRRPQLLIDREGSN